MSWDKPKTGKGWLLLCVPPSFCVVLTFLGGLFDRQDGNWTGWAIVGLLLATISAFGISLWLARLNPTAGGKVGAAILCFVCFMLVIGAVSFAGCAIGFSLLPGLDFR